MPKDRIRRLAEAAIKRALGVVTGDRRLEAEGIAEQAAGAARAAEPAPGRVPGRAAPGPHRRGALRAVQKGDA